MSLMRGCKGIKDGCSGRSLCMQRSRVKRRNVMTGFPEGKGSKAVVDSACPSSCGSVSYSSPWEGLFKLP